MIRNQRTLLQRNHVEPPALALQRLKRLAQQAASAEAMDELLGIEGSAARLYFEHFGEMLKVEDERERPAFEPAAETGKPRTMRERRPAREPVQRSLKTGCLAQ